MRLVVFGERGMLGRAVTTAVDENGKHWRVGTSEGNPIDICDGANIEDFLELARPDAVINCAGAIPERRPFFLPMVRSNALGPVVLAEACATRGIRLVHVSTDCVFSGHDTERLRIQTPPAPRDLYGRSKLLGEIIAETAAVVVRTSFIGPDHGLMRWLLDQPPGAEVEGWLGAIWTGSSVYAVARALIEIAEGETTGLCHLATERIYSKCEILEALIGRFGLDVKVRRVMQPRINRALEPTHLLPPFGDVLEELAERAELVRTP